MTYAATGSLTGAIRVPPALGFCIAQAAWGH